MTILQPHISVETLLHHTESICPLCLARIPARLIACADEVLMVKECGDHGQFRTRIWRGMPAFSAWKRPKAVARVDLHATEIAKGCPFDCGICPDHRQRGCTGLLEITARCNLACNICFADSGANAASDPSLETIAGWYRKVLATNGPCSIQLSGGEPTLRDDLPQIIALGRAIGFSFIQLNSNGLRLGENAAYAKRLKQAGLVSVFLQYDGTEDEIYRQLRGRPLLREKHRAIAHCIDAGLGVVLVPTLVPGINSHNLGEIVRTALDFGPGVRGVHFQPASRFGRYRVEGATQSLTLPEVMSALVQQSSGLVRLGDFLPPGGEHERCSFHGSFLRTANGTLRAVSTPQDTNCCCSTGGEADILRTVALVAQQWSAPPEPPGEKTNGSTPPLDFDSFVEQTRRNSFTLSGMAFQDAGNLDLERLRSCCIHVVAPDGRLIPFCAYNLTASDGTSLYRGRCR
jgi:uncharacterized radical SAM superfamily Fe-S cluster-containing enzyme